MSVKIINLTGNRDGFEDDFATNLSSNLTHQCVLISLRGEDVLEFPPMPMQADVKLLVFICHGLRIADNTELDIGLDEHPYRSIGYFSSPDILSRFAINIESYFAVIYFVCDSFSPGSIVAFDNEEKCLGTISNTTEVDTSHFVEMSCLLNQIHDVLDLGCNKENIISHIKNVMEVCIKNDGLKDFVFTENLLVTELNGVALYYETNNEPRGCLAENR